MSGAAEKCGSCRFWDTAWTRENIEQAIGDDYECGECRRFPPTWTHQGVFEGWPWPVTMNRDWCGEYKGGKDCNETR